MSRDDFPSWAHIPAGWHHWEAWFITARVLAGPACFLEGWS